MSELETLADGLVFPEGPRWRGDTLWFSDILDQQVKRIDRAGVLHTVVTVEAQPSGLGFTLDGALLVVSMLDRRLLRVVDDHVVDAVDLSDVAVHPCNDMVVDAHGRAYVGCMGIPIEQASQGVGTGTLLLVEPDGRARVVADGLSGPNGCVISLDASTLIVAESIAMRLTAFSIDADGSLTERRVWCDVGFHCDGICLDAEGSIWVGSPRSNGLLRVDADGRMAQRIDTERAVIACALGGADGRTLHLCTVDSMSAGDRRSVREGRIETMRVDVPGVEMP